jgi:hypothetical protein
MQTTKKQWMVSLTLWLLSCSGQATADTGCYWEFNEQAASLCLSQHGNVTYLGPDPNYYYGPSLYKEGYGLCGGGETIHVAEDFGPVEAGFTSGADTTQLGSPNTVLFSREANVDGTNFRFSQVAVRDMVKMEVRIAMTITNIDITTLSASLYRFIARAPSGSVGLAARTERSVLVFEEGSGHGVALTDVTWPPHPNTATQLVSPDDDSLFPSCSLTPGVGNRAGGAIRYESITVPPGASRTFTVRYRGF